jgi:hypothetical protein
MVCCPWVGFCWFTPLGLIYCIDFSIYSVWANSIPWGEIGIALSLFLRQSFILYGLILALALLLTAIFVGLLWILYYLIPYLGIYKKLKSESPLGESFWNKVFFYFALNAFLSIFFVTVQLYFLYPSNAPQVGTISNLTVSSTRLSDPDIVYILSMGIVPGYLLATRLLANPTEKMFRLPIFRKYCVTEESKKSFVRDFKNGIISFNIALVLVAVLYLFYKLMAASINNALQDEYSKYYSHFNVETWIFLLIIYGFVLLTTTFIGELILLFSPPYEKD